MSTGIHSLKYHENSWLLTDFKHLAVAEYDAAVNGSAFLAHYALRRVQPASSGRRLTLSKAPVKNGLYWGRVSCLFFEFDC